MVDQVNVKCEMQKCTRVFAEVRCGVLASALIMAGLRLHG